VVSGAGAGSVNTVVNTVEAYITGIGTITTRTAADKSSKLCAIGSGFFIPGNILPGDYRFEVKTAGSVGLLLQAILLPLSLADSSSRLTLVGGTHVPWSPPFHYLHEVLFRSLKTMGISVEAHLGALGLAHKGRRHLSLLEYIETKTVAGPKQVVNYLRVNS
jgi:RNA 3'-terminal phosphate cyclase